MKKYFLSIVALAGMLFATSCQESLVEPQMDGTTTFTVQLPEGMGTKAYGDEASTQATINRLYVEVYSKDGKTLVYEPSVITMNNATATVTLNLVSTQEYDIIFWAQNEFCTYDVSDLRSVKMNANHHNSETGAAFYAVLNDYTPVNGQQGVTLTRPFAQLNLGTTTEVSYTNGTNNKVTIESAKITVKGVAPSFDRINGQTSGEGYAPSNEVTYTYENTDATTNFPKAAGEIEVAGKTYQYVSMDYFAVPGGTQSTVQVTAEIKVKDPNGVESTITRVIENVPVQLNYKTNIVGNLITSATEFEVIVEEAWKGTNDKEVEFREVATAQELEDAIEAGVDNITLTEDIVLTKTLEFGTAPIPGQGSIARASESVEDEGFVLDLNGKTITTAWENQDAGKHYYAFTNYANSNLVVKNGTIEARGIFNYGVLTLENGTINAIDGNGGYAVRNYSGSEFIMNGGTLATTLEDDNQVNNGGYDATTLRVDAGATATINGGVIRNICDFTFAIDNAGTTTVNGGEITSVHSTVSSEGDLTINGGSFTCNGIEGVTAHALIAWDGSVTTINGGEFNGKDNYNGFNVDADRGSVVNICGGKFLPVHSGSLYGEGTIIVSGGTFFDDPSEKRLAEGYRISIKDGWYEVEPITVEVSTADELVAALENNQNVIFANDITIAATKGGYSKAGILQNKAQAINGDGHTLTVTGAGATWDCAIYTNGGIIKNLTVAGAMRGIFTAGQQSDLYIDNVEFKNVIYTFNSDDGNKNYGVYISNSTLNGWTSFSDVHKEVVFTNCTFGEGSGYAFCRPYNACVFENCEFSTDMEFDTSKVANIVFKNCTYGGVKITAENAASLKTGEVTFFYNGVGSVSFK